MRYDFKLTDSRQICEPCWSALDGAGWTANQVDQAKKAVNDFWIHVASINQSDADEIMEDVLGELIEIINSSDAEMRLATMGMEIHTAEFIRDACLGGNSTLRLVQDWQGLSFVIALNRAGRNPPQTLFLQWMRVVPFKVPS